MRHLLLLGAGFSKNWGGLLASEVRSDLASRLQREPFLSDLLHRSNDLYAPPMPLARSGVWNSCYFPGMRPHGDWINDAENVMWTPSGDFAPPHHSQPVFKLHGSTNWVEQHDGAHPQGDRLLILGDAKGGAIDASPVLSFYRDEFLRLLSQRGAKLLVIGYGFLDDHINDLICRAHGTNHFTVYLVHPSGRAHLRNINRTSRGAIYVPQPIEDIPIADFTNPLRNTFGGDDLLDHQRLCRFFEE